MLARSFAPSSSDANNNVTKKRLILPKTGVKRSQSVSPASLRSQNPVKKGIVYKRRHSLSPSTMRNQTVNKPQEAKLESSAPEKINLQDDLVTLETEKELSMPQAVITKSMRSFATKRREFVKIRKNVICQQNLLLEVYAQMREIESRTGVVDGTLGDVRVVSINGWPAHDLLLLLRTDITSQLQQDINDGIASQVLRQLQANLNFIPEEVRSVNAELIQRRNEVMQLIRSKHRIDRASYHTNIDWKLKNADLDSQTEKLNKMTAKLTDNIKSKIKEVFEMARISWIDRETLVKKVERLQNENVILQHKIEEALKKNCEDSKEGMVVDEKEKVLTEQLTKERSEKEALKEVISAAESMLRVARTRIGSLERQLKEVKFEFETARRKHKEFEQLYRHRELNYDTRTKKLVELSRTGEITIETLSRQRDALELRVKELLEQMMSAEKTIADREAELKARTDALQAKVDEKEKENVEATSRVAQLQGRIKELEQKISIIQEQCARLINIEKEHCLKYLPSKENEPSDRETEIWKELQVTRTALAKAEDELRQSRVDKDSFLNSLSRIAGTKYD